MTQPKRSLPLADTGSSSSRRARAPRSQRSTIRRLPAPEYPTMLSALALAAAVGCGGAVDQEFDGDSLNDPTNSPYDSPETMGAMPAPYDEPEPYELTGTGGSPYGVGGSGSGGGGMPAPYDWAPGGMGGSASETQASDAAGCEAVPTDCDDD